MAKFVVEDVYRARDNTGEELWGIDGGDN